MPRKTLRRLLPRMREGLRAGALRTLFGELIFNPNLWHLNRFSVAWAVSVGLFMAFMPAPSQMVLAGALAILIGCNLPIAVAVVWVSNPITMAPMFFAAYKLGAWMLDMQPQAIQFEMSLHWLMTKLGAIWEPFLLGCVTLGLLCAAVGHATVRIIWRTQVVSSWKARRRRRLERQRRPDKRVAADVEESVGSD